MQMKLVQSYLRCLLASGLTHGLKNEGKVRGEGESVFGLQKNKNQVSEVLVYNGDRYSEHKHCPKGGVGKYLKENGADPCDVAVAGDDDEPYCCGGLHNGEGTCRASRNCCKEIRVINLGARCFA